MSSYSQKVHAILQRAETKKITDRKDFLQSLTSILSNQEVVHEITENSKSRSNEEYRRVVWNNIFFKCHQFLADETRNPSSHSQKTIQQMLSDSSTLLLDVVRYSNKPSEVYLKFTDLISALFEILENDIFRPVYNTYIKILMDYILSIRLYRVRITYDDWKKILKICRRLYERNCIRKDTTLQVLQLVVHYGCFQSHLVQDVKMMLPFLLTVFDDVINDPSILAKSAYKLIYTVCKEIVTECRKALCEFSEKIIPRMMSVDGETYKYKLLLLFVVIHHPDGVISKNPIAYAHDWKQWQRMMMMIYKHILKNIKNVSVLPTFAELAGEVFKQILEDRVYRDAELNITDHDSSMRIKRRRLSSSINKPLDFFNIDLKNTDIENRSYIVEILTAMIKKYPNILDRNDFPHLLDLISDLLGESIKNERIINSLCKFCKILIKTENILTDGLMLIEITKKYWEKIWHVLLRILGLNQNEKEGHELLQLMIIHINTLPINELLCLYINNEIRWTQYSLNSLFIVCQYVNISEYITEYPSKHEDLMKNQLISWLLNFPPYKPIMPTTMTALGKILINLTLKTWYRDSLSIPVDRIILHDQTLLHDNDLEDLLTNISKYYSTLSCKLDIFTINTATPTISNANNGKESIKPLISENILNFIAKKLCELIYIGEEIKDIFDPIFRLATVATFISNLLEMNVESNHQQLQTVQSCFTESFVNLHLFIIKNDLLNRKHGGIIDLIRALITLYGIPYHHTVAAIIIEHCPREFLLKLLELINVENNFELSQLEEDLGVKYYKHIFEYRDHQQSQQRSKRLSNHVKVNDEHAIVVGAHKIIALFGCMNSGKGIFEIQQKVLSNLLQVKIYAPTVIGNFWQSLVFLNTVVSCPVGFYSRECMELIINFINELFHKWDNDGNAIKAIVEILPCFLDHLIFIGGNTASVIEILLLAHRSILKNNLGSSMCSSFFKSLDHIIQLNPSFQLLPITSSEDTISITDTVLEYTGSSFFNVRFESIKILHSIFHSDHIGTSIKRVFFNNIKRCMLNLFSIDVTMPDLLKQDEWDNIVTTVLYVFGSIINATGLLQTEALTFFMQLHGEKEVSINAILKILNTAIKNETYRKKLIEMNLYSLMITWINGKFCLQPFPWMLTESSSEEEFYKNYMGILFLIKLESHQLSAIITMCDKRGYSFSEMIEVHFPDIMAWLLPNLSSDRDGQYAKEILQRLSKNQEEFRNVAELSVLIENKIADILINLIQRLHDTKNYTEMFGEEYVCFPRVYLPNFNSTVLKKCFLHLEKFCPTLNNSLISYLTMKNSSVLQNVLLTLSNNIYEYPMIGHKLKAFHQYAFFCDFLVQDVSQKSFDEIAMFFLKEVCYTLLHLINKGILLLSKVSAKYFYKFLKTSLPSRSTEISKILDFIVVNLISAVQTNKIDRFGLKILYFLITHSHESMKTAVSKLDPFPNGPSFEKHRTAYSSLKKSSKSSSIRDEIEIFLNFSDEKITTYNSEVLSNLRQILSNKKHELIDIYKDLEKLRGFTEDCKSSIIHRLIYRLVKLTENSNKATSLEIAKCLGELGPTNLTTMILHSEEGQVEENGEFDEIFTCKLIIILVDFIVSNNIKLRKASANALYKICETFWGQEALSARYLNSEWNSQGEMLRSLVHPFISKNVGKSKMLKLNKENFDNYICPENELWRSNKIHSYAEWIVNVSCNILKCFDNLYFASLIPICQLNIDFCELILPKLVYFIILTSDKVADSICKCINQFFGEYFHSVNDLKQNMEGNIEKAESFSHKSMKCMLNITNYIRIQEGDNFMLKLNYLHVAKAAQYCSAHFSSIFYAELYCEIFKRSITRNEENTFIIDHIREKNINDGKMLQDILREAFKEIGDPDSIHGCGLSHLKDLPSRIQHYVYLQQWDKVMIAEDAELSSGHIYFDGMAKALRHSGFDYLLSRFTSTLNHNENINANEYLYETAWRLSDWNIPPNKQHLELSGKSKNVTNDLNYYYYHYQALKSLQENDNISVGEYIDNARIGIIESFHNVSLECSETLYPKLVKLQMLLELDQLATTEDKNLSELSSSWNLYSLPNLNDFSYVEPIMSQRVTMYKIKNIMNKNSHCKSALINTYLELSKIAEMQGHAHIAARILISLSKENNLSDDIKNQLKYRDALLSWTRNDHEIARFLMKDLISTNGINPSLSAQALRIYGNWMAETKSENPQSIIEKYYDKSIDVFSQIKNRSEDDAINLNDTYAALAQFSDTQYRQINAFMKTPQYESLKECAEYAKKATSISSVTKDSDVKRALSTFQKQNTIDSVEYKNIQSEQKMYLLLAVKYYLMTLQTGENHNFFVFRLVSLWLENKDIDNLNHLFENFLKNIPCFKLIPLVPQLAPHLCKNRDNIFKSGIYELLKRCIKTHPHHTLPILFALVHTRKDYDYHKPNSSTRLEANERELGAKQLISEFKDNKIYPIIVEMKNLADALIMLAYFQFDNRKNRHRIPESQKIHNVHNYKHCVVPTIILDVHPKGDYNDIVSVHKYDSYFECVGGVNLPKKVICIGTDGVRRKQLVKGKDDLKQDAVMQQVFTIMNLLLGTSKETKRRKLSIRTYKVVPLSQRSGVLEWCDNSQPIITILAGTTNSMGMHQKYYPNDWKIEKCRNKIKDVATQSNVIRRKAYLQCCENLHPALHFFFMDSFRSPEVWFERRLAYVRSVATNSMVGYILGLGDRHFSNILLDQMTAEVIHIDFGIAFEQGKVLPVPETVPFRLTRDMETAMGVSGVEGVMRKCSEETMTVLRNRRDIIITLLQVLLYDPLFSWAITPAKAWELQSDQVDHVNDVYYKAEDKFNKIAERALLRIEQKLQGTEDGLPTSITGQVERLIQEARDPANLSRLFCGWQAYL